ncbi:MAG: hypothetical protein ACM3VZ_09750 [Acidobacteriota bacterium]
MRSVVPHEGSTVDLATIHAWERAMALTIGQLQPRQPEPAEPLPVAEAREMAWEDWCAAAAGVSGSARP